jgi:hypothetical protein
MATFSFGSGTTPGAPGTYINERGGNIASAGIALFNTTYMLVETEEGVPVTRFPFNTPVPVTSLEDFRALVGTIPTSRIPLMSYNCVNEFFLNAQVGDLRVVRVGTPNQILEIELLPSASKTSSTGLPSDLEAGDLVYAQFIINGQKLVAGDGSTGYTSSGEWLGVPVIIPVDYVDGDEVNNRKISRAIADAVADAVESNPSIRSSVYVRTKGLVNDLDNSGSQNGYVVIAGTTFDSPVTVVPKSESPGSAYVFSVAAYDISTANGQQANLERVPQDYIQCLGTAFDGQRDQGYLITPTAYAQFDSLGRASVGAAAASLVEQPEFKWLALADPGPYLVTDINKYKGFTPHKPAADLSTGKEYLVDNAIYEWVGPGVTYPKLNYQRIVSGGSPKIAVQQSTNPAIAPQERVGALDKAYFTVWSPTAPDPRGRLNLDEGNYWPVDVKIQKVVLSNADGSDNPFSALEGEVYVVAPPYFTEETGDYSLNTVFLAPSLTAAKSLLGYVQNMGGSKFVTALPPGAINIPNDDDIFSAKLTYETPNYNFPVTINGQTSDLLENVRNQVHGVNTLHLPGTLQDPTDTFNVGLFARTFTNPSASGVGNGGVYRGTGKYADNVVFDCASHNLADGVKVFFTAPVITAAGRFLVNATTKRVQNPYYVKVINDDSFTLSSSLTNFSASSYLKMPVGDSVATTSPVIVYSALLAGGEEATAGELGEALVVPMIRARKYALDSSSIYNQASPSSAPPASAVEKNRGLAIQISKSASVLGEGTVAPIGETPNAGWLPQLELLDPPAPATALAVLYGNEGSIASVAPNYVTRDVNGYATAIDDSDGLLPGSQGYWNVEGEALMFVPPVWVENNGLPTTMTWEWEVSSDGGATWTGTGDTDVVGVIAGDTFPISDGDKVRVAWSLTDGDDTITGETAPTYAFIAQSDLAAEGYNLAGNTQVQVLGATEGWYVGRVLAYNAASLNAVSDTPTTATGKETVVKSYAGDTIYPLGTDTVAQGIKASVFNTYQIPGSTNGSYIGVQTSFVIGDLNGGTNPGDKPKLINTATAGTAIGTLQAFAVTNWTNTATTPEAWSTAIAGIDVAFFGPQNFVCIPTVEQDFSTESYLVPNFPAFVGGSYDATVKEVSDVVADGYAEYAGLTNGSNIPTSSALLQPLMGVALKVEVGGTLPVAAGGAVVTPGQYIVVTEANGVYSWAITDDEAGLQTYGVPLYGSSTRVSYRNQQTPPPNLWRFDAVTSTEIIDGALRGIFSNGVPEAVFVEAGVDNVNRLYEDSQRYFNPMGFIAFYGSYILNAAGQFIPPSPYVTGVALRRYRAEGFQFPPAGVKYQLADAIGVQIQVNSSQQNLLNPDGCNVVRSLPGYPDTAVFIWGGRTRINPAVADQRKFQFVNTRVIQNVVYGSLRSAFDNQIFSVVDGFGVVFNQIVSIGNSVMNQLYTAGALYGNKPSDAFEVICDERINSSDSLEQGIVNVKVFDVPVPTLERIQIDLIRVSIGQMKNELASQGLDRG